MKFRNLVDCFHGKLGVISFRGTNGDSLIVINQHEIYSLNSSYDFIIKNLITVIYRNNKFMIFILIRKCDVITFYLKKFSKEIVVEIFKFKFKFN